MPPGPSEAPAIGFTAYLLSCAARRPVRSDTLASLRASDWGAEAVVALDQDRFVDPLPRVTETARAILVSAHARGAEMILVLEDDVDVNRHLRHNLERWSPVVSHRRGDYFFATLYNPNIAPPATEADPASAYPVDPEHVYGAQGFFFSRATARWLLDHWDEHIGAPDIRMPRLAARVSPVWIHRPSLVQHRPVASLWGGVEHAAVDFSADWRAPEG